MIASLSLTLAYHRWGGWRKARMEVAAPAPKEVAAEPARSMSFNVLARPMIRRAAWLIVLCRGSWCVCLIFSRSIDLYLLPRALFEDAYV